MAAGIPRRTLAGLVLGTVAVGAGLAGAIVLLFRESAPQEVVTAAQRVLRERFPPEAAIRFAPVDETHLESTDEDHCIVTGWVEITDPQGRTATFDFSCLMLTVPGGRWISEKVELTPRP